MQIKRYTKSLKLSQEEKILHNILYISYFVHPLQTGMQYEPESTEDWMR